MARNFSGEIPEFQLNAGIDLYGKKAE